MSSSGKSALRPPGYKKNPEAVGNHLIVGIVEDLLEDFPALPVTQGLVAFPCCVDDYKVGVIKEGEEDGPVLRRRVGRHMVTRRKSASRRYFLQ